MPLCHNEDYLDARISKGRPLAWTFLGKGTRKMSNTTQPRGHGQGPFILSQATLLRQEE